MEKRVKRGVAGRRVRSAKPDPEGDRSGGRRRAAPPSSAPRRAELPSGKVANRGRARDRAATAIGVPSPADALAAVERELDARGIGKVKLGGFDVDGLFRGKYVSREKFRSAAAEGLGFCDVIFGWDSADALYDNATVTGWHTGYPDAGARIDLSSFRPIPWEPGTAAFLLDYFGADGEPHPASPRGLLRRVIGRAEGMGFSPRIAFEFEFFCFRETPESIRDKGYRNLVPLSPGMFGYSWLRASEHAALVHAWIDGCREFGIPIEGIHTETGPGVYEAALQYAPALEAADRAALFKTAAKELARRQGVMACFMAKWNADLPGCSGHVHQSLWDRAGARNLFHDPGAEHGMSRAMRHFLGGQLHLMPELTALVSPTVNSYKRYVPGVWAPLNATWGFENRTCALRVIGAGQGSRPAVAKALRVEHRQVAADANPYVATAALLAAGLWGIEHEIEPTPPSREDATRGGAPPLPGSLEEAVHRLAESRTAREILGDGFVDHYLRTREWEVRQYRRAVTDWELARYFETV
jgi:glutamine synthetase